MIPKRIMFKIQRHPLLIIALLFLCLQSCSSKKEIIYFQDASDFIDKDVKYQKNTIQPNDILSIAISALVPETAIAYNKQMASKGSTQPATNIEVLKLQGYLVDNDGLITLPVLGNVDTKGKTIKDLERYLYMVLEKENHLVKPSVNIRLLNAKITVLGEVKLPGTFTFTEQVISIPQALGYAGDLTINGKRTDIMLIREVDGVRSIFHIDLTSTDWMDDENYFVKPNDVLIISPNNAKIKSAGYIGNVSSVLSVLSLLITTTVLLTN